MKSHRLYRSCLNYAFITAFLIPTVSKSADIDHLLAMGMSDLMNITIVSKREEPINKSPGIVTVITETDIKRYGAKNLRDILDRQTSLQVIGSNLFPRNKISMRGATTSHIDNNILLSINGRPLREASVSSLNHDVYDLFPLNAIHKIEIIRGPGSVLYGTNAFSGVINIITKSASSTPEMDLALTYGSFDTKQLEWNGGISFQDLKVFASINRIDTDGGEFDSITDEFGNIDEYKVGVDGTQLILNMEYNDLTLNGFYSDSITDNVRSIFSFPSTELDFTRHWVDLGYKHNFTDRWNASLNVSHHHSKSTLTARPPPATEDPEEGSDHYLAELTSIFSASDSMTILAGGTYSKSQDANGSFEYSTNTYSLYSQIDFQTTDQLNLIAGFQYNKPSEISGDISPRLGLIYNLNTQWGIKLLYSSAFREASPLERFINIPSIVKGNPLLNPETIDTLDAQLFFYDDSKSFSITYFNSQQKDIITRQPGTPVQTINDGEITFNGIELEGRFQLSDNLNIQGNISYQTNENEENEKDVTYSPDLMAKMGLAYDMKRGISIGVFNSYFSESTLQNSDIGSTNPVNPDADDYLLITANVNLELGALFQSTSWSHYTASIYFDNLLDEEIYFPSINRTSVNSIPHAPGRGVYATVEARF